MYWNWIQRVCNKHNRIAEKLNQKWLGSLVVSNSRKKIPVLRWEDRKRGQTVLLELRDYVGLGKPELQLICLPGGHTDSDALRNRERRRNTLLLPCRILQSPFLPSYQLGSARRHQHGSQPEKCSSHWTQLSWDRENRRKSKNGWDNNSPMTGAHGMLPFPWLVFNWGVNGSMSFFSPWVRSLVALFPLSHFPIPTI